MVFTFTSVGKVLQSSYLGIFYWYSSPSIEGKATVSAEAEPQLFPNHQKINITIVLCLLLPCPSCLLKGIEIFELSTFNVEWFPWYSFSKASTWTRASSLGFHLYWEWENCVYPQRSKRSLLSSQVAHGFSGWHEEVKCAVLNLLCAWVLHWIGKSVLRHAWALGSTIFSFPGTYIYSKSPPTKIFTCSYRKAAQRQLGQSLWSILVRHTRSCADTFAIIIFTLNATVELLWIGMGTSAPHRLSPEPDEQNCREAAGALPWQDDEQSDMFCIRIKGRTEKGDTAVSVCYRPSDKEEDVDEPFCRRLEVVSLSWVLVLVGNFNLSDVSWRKSTARLW